MPPQTDLERSVIAVWQEILGVDPVGMHDNFFELGGNSLAGLRLVQRLRERLGAVLSEVSLYESPTAATLTRAIAAHRPQAENTDGGSPRRELGVGRARKPAAGRAPEGTASRSKGRRGMTPLSCHHDLLSRRNDPWDLTETPP